MIGSTLACSRVAKGKFIIESILIVAICLLAVAGPKPFFIWVSHDQKLYMLTLKLIATPASELTIDARTGTYDLTADDINLLKSLDLRGRLEGYTQVYYGDGKPGRAIIIMQHQLKSPVELPQPDRTTVIYVQDGDEWKMYPVNAPTLKRTIRLEVSESGNDVTEYWVEHADGAKSGGQAFYWK